tara:strand:+ start:1320 stop:1721 length:402 start_codon:yes stop_codon:yes gene_type:complete
MKDKSKKILSEISAGELLDKISILEIKLEKIEDEKNREEIKKEHAILKNIQSSSIKLESKIEELFISLKKVNLSLWNVEDSLRICEKNKEFGKKFVALAREVYFNNDKRSKIKSEINELLGSNIREVKQYVKY